MNDPASSPRKDDPVPVKWRWHYGALQRIRELLVREREEHAHAFKTPHERGGTDMMDVAADESAHETLLAEIRREGDELAEVECALQRIRDGTYGICELTGQPISIERLRAVPWTRLSQAAVAKKQSGPGR